MSSPLILQNDILSIGKLLQCIFSQSQANCINVKELFNFPKEYYDCMPRYYMIIFDLSLNNFYPNNNQFISENINVQQTKAFNFFKMNQMVIKVLNIKNTVNNIINLPDSKSGTPIEEQIYKYLVHLWDSFMKDDVRQRFNSGYTNINQLLGMRPIYFNTIDDLYININIHTKHMIIGNDKEIKQQELLPLLFYIGKTRYLYKERLQLFRQLIELIYFLSIHCGVFIDNIDPSIFFVDSNDKYLCIINYENLIRYSNLMKFFVNNEERVVMKIPQNFTKLLNENQYNLNVKKYQTMYINTNHIVTHILKSEQEDMNMKDIRLLPSQESAAQQIFTENYINSLRKRKTLKLKQTVGINLSVGEFNDIASKSSVKKLKMKNKKKKQQIRINAVDKKFLAEPVFIDNSKQKEKIYNPSEILNSIQDSAYIDTYTRQIFNFIIYSVQTLLFIILPTDQSDIIKYFKKYHLGNCLQSGNKTNNRCHLHDFSFNQTYLASIGDVERFTLLLHKYICHRLWNETRFQHLTELTSLNSFDIKRVYLEFIITMLEFVNELDLV